MPTNHPHIRALIGPLGWPELLVLTVLGVLIFGRRLPELGKSLGKGIVGVKTGLADIEDDARGAHSLGWACDGPFLSRRWRP